MPTLSERQALIQLILLSTEDERDKNMVRIRLESEDEPFVDEHEGESSDSSLSSTSSTSSTSSSSSSSGSSLHHETTNTDSEDEHMDRLSYYTQLFQVILETRVLNPHSVAKSSQLYLVLVQFKESDPKRFRLNLRVSPSTFDELLLRIRDDAVFHNRSNNQQYPVEIQLAIALYRFGHDGNGSSVEAIAQWAGVSAGMVVKATRRVMVAFMRLHDAVIRWVTEDEKEEAKEWVDATSCPEWRDGFCMVDGTLIPLFEKPGHHGEAYFDRKSNYSLNIQVPSPASPLFLL